MPRVSIIVPCRNGERFLAQALDSALAQTYRNCEVVGIDDGSQDRTRAVLQRYAARHTPRMKGVYRPESGGASAARNAGCEAASGEYLLFLDADDVLELHAIEHLVDLALARTPSGAFGNWRNFWESTSRAEIRRAAPFYPEDAYASFVRAPMFHTAVLLQRPDIRWNERRVVWEALEYVLQSVVPLGGLAYLDEVVVNVRQHESPERFSVRHDHFEPGVTGAFFVEQKAKLAAQRCLGFERAEALDQRITANACMLVRAGRREEAVSMLEAVSWVQVHRYDWFRARSFVGVARRLGPRLGSAAFFHLNRALNRL